MTLKNVMRRCWEHDRYAAMLILAGVITAAAVVPVEASSIDNTTIIHNEQQLDLFTGEPVVPEELKSEIRLTQYCTYDKGEQRYVYQFGDTVQQTVYASVADGMFTNESVSIIWSDPIDCKVYRNGHGVDYQSGSGLTEPGFYQTLITDKTNAGEYSIAFSIIDKYTNSANYMIPEGFRIEEVMYEGSAAMQTGNLISLSREGTYHIALQSLEGEVRSVVDLTVDHTPPTLLLAEVDEKGFAHSAVDVSDAEPGARLYATVDGSECNVGRRLTQPGFYRLTVQDEAGNSTEYTFTIRMYFTISTVVVILLLIAVLAALGTYVAVTRWRITVR